MTGLEATVEELEKLKDFRARVNKFYPECDEKLLPWLRARELDVGKAEQMLRRHLIWRKNNEIEELKNWRPPKVFFPYIHFGFDREGAPVYLLPIGKWEMKAAIESGDIVPSLRYIYQVLEMIVSTCHNKRIYQGIVICDFDGFGYKQIAHRAVLQGMLEVLRVFEANYPEVLKAAYVINAPKVFNYLFTLVKPLLNSRTLAKVEIFGPNRPKWQEALLKRIHEDQIPPFWGGTKPGQDEFCSEHWFMEPLPPNFFKKCAAMYDEFGDEWISIKVPARENVLFEYKVSQSMAGSSLLKWSFSTDGYDVGFSVKYSPANETEDIEGEVLVPYQRVESHLERQEGVLPLNNVGVYTLTFDNAYSRTRSKMLQYCITVVSDMESTKSFKSINIQDEFEDVNENICSSHL